MFFYFDWSEKEKCMTVIRMSDSAHIKATPKYTLSSWEANMYPKPQLFSQAIIPDLYLAISGHLLTKI